MQAEEPNPSAAASDAWYRDMAGLTAELGDPAAWEQLDGCLREADEQAKAWVRREMGRVSHSNQDTEESPCGKEQRG